MILGLPNTQTEFCAVQAVAHIQRVDRSLSRSLLEGMLRELIEHWTLRAWLGPEETLAGRQSIVEKGLASDLQGRGVTLRKLELRPLPHHSAQNPEDCVVDWTEALIDDIVTKDGFQLGLDVVVRTWVGPAVLEMEGGLSSWKSTLKISLERELRDLCRDRDLEELLGHRSEWAGEALRRLADGEVDEALDQLHLEFMRPGHHAGLDSLWVTEIKVKARHDAFRPQSKPRYADPFQHFFFQAYGDVIRQPQQVEDSDR